MACLEIDALEKVEIDDSTPVKDLELPYTSSADVEGGRGVEFKVFHESKGYVHFVPLYNFENIVAPSTTLGTLKADTRELDKATYRNL